MHLVFSFCQQKFYRWPIGISIKRLNAVRIQRGFDLLIGVFWAKSIDSEGDLDGIGFFSHDATSVHANAAIVVGGCIGAFWYIAWPKDVESGAARVGLEVVAEPRIPRDDGLEPLFGAALIVACPCR